MTIEQLEQQAERNRAAVTDTLDELNKRLTPGQIVDQVMGYMQNGGNDFLNNLGKQVTNNPLPVTLIGAGLAWFLFARNEPASNGYGSYSGAAASRGNGAASAARSATAGLQDAAGAAADAAAGVTGKIGDMASAAANGVSSAAQGVGDAATGAFHAVEDAASNAYHQATDGLNMVKDSAMQMEERTVAAARSAMAFCQDQPLVLAGIGLAFGAALGAALPHTELEDELLGETSDEMKDAAKEMAVDQLGNAKEAAHKLGDALKDNLEAESDEMSGDKDETDEDITDDTAIAGTSSTQRGYGSSLPGGMN